MVYLAWGFQFTQTCAAVLRRSRRDRPTLGYNTFQRKPESGKAIIVAGMNSSDENFISIISSYVQKCKWLPYPDRINSVLIWFLQKQFSKDHHTFTLLCTSADGLISTRVGIFSSRYCFSRHSRLYYREVSLIRIVGRRFKNVEWNDAFQLLLWKVFSCKKEFV